MEDFLLRENNKFTCQTIDNELIIHSEWQQYVPKCTYNNEILLRHEAYVYIDKEFSNNTMMLLMMMMIMDK